MGRRLVRRPCPPAPEWVEAAAGALPRVLITGGRRARIENHLGVLEFTERRVRLKTREGVLTLSGEGLTLERVRPDAVTVEGAIFSMELPGKDKEACAKE